MDELEDVPDHTVLWRYTDLASLIWILTEQALVFRSPQSFDDKFEGAWPELAIETIHATVGPSHHHIFDGPLLKDIYVSCWHKFEEENHLMWKAYGPSSGVAIRTTAGAIRSALPPGFVRVRKIRYANFATEQCWPGNPEEAVLRKRQEFSGEAEVRVLTGIGTKRSQSTLCRTVDRDRIALSVDPAILILEIVLSDQISFVKDGLEQILSSLGIAIPLRLSTLSALPIRVSQKRDQTNATGRLEGI
jgi:hypothetical protein